MSIRPVLVFGYGNPSRGDDALGPLLIERLEVRQRAGELQQVELLTDFQLQVEHALDLAGRELAVFVDAAASGDEPFSFSRAAPEKDASYTTHAMSAGAVLRVYENTTGEIPPPTWLVAVRGYAFDLGAPLSLRARSNLDSAEAQLLEFLRDLGIKHPV